MIETLLAALLVVNLLQLYQQSDAARRWVRDARITFTQWRNSRNGKQQSR